MSRTETAICIFAYNRASHLRFALSALSQNEEARPLDLRIYIDGPRNRGDVAACAEALHVCHEPWSFKSVVVIERQENLGLYASLTTGITETLDQYQATIIIEDDIVSSPYLVRYFLDALAIYHDTVEVASIHGYSPPIRSALPETYFLRGADCWGWATWRDRWKLFRHDSAEMAQEIRERGLVHEFNLNGNYDFLGMLDMRAAGLNNSWAICWHASCFLANKLTLYPGKSLVKNIGLDGTGEHCGPSKVMATEASLSPVRVEKIPVEVNPSVYSKYCNHFSSNRSGNSPLKAIKAKIKNRFLQLVNRNNYSRLALIGPYDSYEEAAQRSSGYESKIILDKVYIAVVDVLEGNYAYERDGTAFAMRPSIDNLRRLLSTYLKENDVVVDFGGGFGGAFINNRDLFRDSNRYTVVEQSNFVEAGRELSKKFGLQIQFIDNLCHLPVKPDVIILSSVLQYIPNAEQVLQEVAELMPRLIIVDRTAFAPNNASQKWWIQDEPAYYQIPISYPNRPLPLEAILSFLSQYSVLERWTNPFDPESPPHGGFLLCRRD